MNSTDILMTGWVASDGVAHLICTNKNSLTQRFAPHMLEDLWRVLEPKLVSEPVPRTMSESLLEPVQKPAPDSVSESESRQEVTGLTIPESDIYIPGEEGFYDSLWNIGERYATGLSVNVDRIPLLQMAVEICEYLEEDIFELSMKGCSFVICRDGARIESELCNRGVKATLIGSFTEDQGRVLTNGDRVTYLTPPKRRTKWR